MSSSTSEVRLSSPSAVWLVASREISTRLRSKAYVLSTAFMLVLIVAGIIVVKFVTGGGGADANVGFTPSTAQIAQSLPATANTIGENVAVSEVATEDDGRAKVSDGSLDALLIGDGSQIQVVVQKDLDGQLKNALNVLASQLALNQQITALGGDPAQVNAAVSEASVQVSPLEEPFPYNAQQLVLGILAGILIYISLLFTGQLVAQGVVEEKASRVVELLLSTIRPWQLMAGKVIGIGLLGLLQVVLIGVVGLIAGLAADVLTISLSAAASTIVWLIVWYLLGFFMYAIVFAALGALVSRQEDVGSVITPALMLVIAGYVVGISVLPYDPDNSFVGLLSIIPVFAPTLMPMRLAMGGVPVWEAALSVGLVVILIPLLLWFAGRIYRNAVMRSGAKVRLRDALKAA